MVHQRSQIKIIFLDKSTKIQKIKKVTWLIQITGKADFRIFLAVVIVVVAEQLSFVGVLFSFSLLLLFSLQ